MNELATTERNFTADQVALIKSQIAVGCTDAELQLFLYTCRKTGLDPLARQIYAIKRGGKMTIQTGIDGYRVIADRTGKLAGITDYLYGHDDPAQKYPTTASVTVRKLVTDSMVAEFTATARWGEYNAGGPMWQKMPYLMLGKCAEALALRKAFPADLSGVYTAEEMAQADNVAIVAEVQAAVEEDNAQLTPKYKELRAEIVGKRTTFEYDNGELTCYIVSVGKKATKDGKEYLVLGIDKPIGEFKSLYYWHNTHQAELLAAKGKVVKMMVTEKPKGITVDAVLEIDGKKVDTPEPLSLVPPDWKFQAETVASLMNFDSEQLRELHALCKADWKAVLEELKKEKTRRESTKHVSDEIPF